jgi:bifunctional enzyme CysN/CysC
VRGATVWFTGIPASGKSTIASAVEERLVGAGRPAYLLDGDNLRHGLNGDLGFSMAERTENVRRTAHVAALMADGGYISLVALVSPCRAHREHARAIHEAAGLAFVEALIDTPLAECERRDPKGLYARARRGEMPGLTGIDNHYELPEAPELILSTLEESVETLVERVLNVLHTLGPQDEPAERGARV